MHALYGLLTFRLDRAGYAALGKRDLALGLACAWIAGVGRYWDHFSAGWPQKLGLGSVVYVFALSSVIWGVLWPLKAHRQRYLTVATSVALTSPLAWLYALPVERWLELGAALSLNLWFLAAVAAWRVLLYARFLFVAARCSALLTLTLTLLPLCAIVWALTILNLEHAVWDLMSGFNPDAPAAQRIVDRNYDIVLFLSGLSMYAFLPLLVLYVIFILRSDAQPARDTPQF